MLLAFAGAGCAGSRSLAVLDPTESGPFAVPYPDSIDAEWAADSTTAPPRPATRPKSKKKKTSVSPTAPGTAATSPGPATGSGTTPPASPDPALPAPSAPSEPTPQEPSPPQLTVRLSAEETARLDEKIQSDLTRAERALAALKDHRLTGEPADQLAAARRFLADALAARAARDVLRGAELAEKARVLAEAVRETILK